MTEQTKYRIGVGLLALMWVVYLQLFFWFFITLLFNAHWAVAQVATAIFTVLLMATTLGSQNKDR
jgi:hypothetical protein